MKTTCLNISRNFTKDCKGIMIFKLIYFMYLLLTLVCEQFVGAGLTEMRSLDKGSHTLSTMRLERKDVPNVQKDMKYILQWTSRNSSGFDLMGQENSAFIKSKCKFRNCYVTDDRKYFLNESEFDAIVFNGRDLKKLWPFKMPEHRIPRQKYIFGAMESADNFPACDENLDGFFNWTWTYKLDSDFCWEYLTIYDLNGNVVGPAIDMKWPSVLKPISEDLKAKLMSKTKAAAWFVSHCSTKSGREYFVKLVQKELKKFGFSVDKYGSCGILKCPKTKATTCFEKIENDYYFYFSFENSFSEDYVTEKLLTALNNYAIPVVYGAANYSRFLPPGSYLDGRELGAKLLARRMNEIISNKSLYHDFFRWRNHYKYKYRTAICKLCEMMNDDEKFSQISVWKNFRAWWNGERYHDNCNL